MFRDPSYFRAIREKVVPHLAHLSVAEGLDRRLQQRRGALFLRHPVPRGGSGGADAVLRHRHQPGCARQSRSRHLRLDRIQLFTENHRKSGGKSSLSDYYSAAYGRASFDKSLRKHVVFSDHSLVTDAVFAEMHLISCRNVLIYFDRDLQDRALGLFKDSLARKGFLGPRGEGEPAVFATTRERSRTSCGKRRSIRGGPHDGNVGRSRRDRRVGGRARGVVGHPSGAACGLRLAGLRRRPCAARQEKRPGRTLPGQMPHQGPRSRGQGADQRRHGLISRRRTIICWSRWTEACRCPTTSRCSIPARRSTSCSKAPPTPMARA